MICKKCGNEVAEGQRFCGVCGADVSTFVEETPAIHEAEEVAAQTEQVQESAEPVSLTKPTEENVSEQENVQANEANAQETPVADTTANNQFSGANQNVFQNGNMNQNAYQNGNMNQNAFQNGNMNQNAYQNGNMNQNAYKNGNMNQNAYQNGNMNQNAYQNGNMNQNAFQNGNMNQNAYQNNAYNNGMYQNQPVKKPFNKKILFIAGGVVAAILVLIIGISLVRKLTGGLAAAGNDRTSYDGPVLGYAGKYIVNSNGDYTDELSDSSYMLEYYMHRDRFNSSAIVIDDKVVYYVDADLNIKKIATGAKYAEIAVDGGYVYYSKSGDKGDDLYVYDTAKDKEKLIAKNVYYSSIAVSPNGKRVAYCKKKNKSGSQSVACVADPLGHEQQLFKVKYHCQFYAISNDIKTYVYSDSKDDATYYVHGKKKVKLASDSFYNRFVVNKDLSEIVYASNDGQTYYLSASTGKPVAIFDNEISSVYTNDVYCNYNSYGYLVWADTLKTCVYRSSSDKYYAIADDGSQGLLVSKEGRFIHGVYDDKLNILVVDGKDIIRYEVTDGDVHKDTVYSGKEEIMSIVGSPDLSHVYFTAGDVVYELYDFQDSEFYDPEDDYDYGSIYNLYYCYGNGNLYFYTYYAFLEVDPSGNASEVSENNYYGEYCGDYFYYYNDEECHYFFGDNEVVFDIDVQ